MLQSIVDTAKDRISSPIFGVFFFSWAVCNWEMLLFVALSELPILERIEYLKANYINFGETVLKPIATAMILTFVIPVCQEAADITLRTIKLLFLKRKQELDAKEDINHQVNILQNAVYELKAIIRGQNNNYSLLEGRQVLIRTVCENRVDIPSQQEYIDEYNRSSDRDYIRYMENKISAYNDEMKKISDIVSQDILPQLKVPDEIENLGYKKTTD